MGARTRTMRDSTNPDDIPKGTRIVGAYGDGPYGSAYAKAVKRFPRATIVGITVEGKVSPHAQVCDCERGDLTPDHAATWAVEKHKAGQHPTIYCNASSWPTAIGAVERAGLRPHVDVSWWIAWEHGGDDTIPAGAIARQYLLNPGEEKHHYDVSNVAAYWPGVDVPGHPLARTSRIAVRLLTRRWKRRQTRIAGAGDRAAVAELIAQGQRVLELP